MRHGVGTSVQLRLFKQFGFRAATSIFFSNLAWPSYEIFPRAFIRPIG